MIVGTAGHIDHGKTRLVHALTGVDTDRLPEEKRRGISIDLGFAYMTGADATLVGFVDVPGHERFIHTMVAGIASIDYGLLAIAADDGIMPQTVEHLQVLDLLGIKRGLVAVTKVDLVDEAWVQETEAEIRALVAGTGLAAAEILRVSSVTGAGIGELRKRLFSESLFRRARADEGAFRFAVDRCFSISGAGTIATGTVLSGSVAVADEVVLLPSERLARVRSLHAQNAPSPRGIAGDRCALVLSGRGIDTSVLGRGDWITAPGYATTTERIDVRMRLLASHDRPLRNWSPVTVHCGASAVAGRVLVLSSQTLVPGGAEFAQIVLARPLPLRHGDRFVVRDPAARCTLGGGRVIDLCPPTRHRRTPRRLEALAALDSDGAEAVLAACLGRPPGLIDLDTFAVHHMLTPEQVAVVEDRQRLVRLPTEQRTFAIAEPALQTLSDRVREVLSVTHRERPEEPGLTLDALRRSLPWRVERVSFRALIQEVARRDVVRLSLPWVHLPVHRMRLAAGDEALWQVIRPMLDQQRFRPPKVRELAEATRSSEQAVRRGCKRLARAGRLIEMAPDRFFLPEAMVDMVRVASELAGGSSREFMAADFTSRIPSGRNTAIQILEFFDRKGLTLRRGNARRLVGDPATWFGWSQGTE